MIDKIDLDKYSFLMKELPSHININGKHYCESNSKNNINYKCITKEPNKNDLIKINHKINFKIPNKPTLLPNGKIYCLKDTIKNNCANILKSNNNIEKFKNNNNIENNKNNKNNKIIKIIKIIKIMFF